MPIKLLPRIGTFLFVIQLSLSLMPDTKRNEFDLPVISSPIHIHRGREDEVLYLYNETRISMSFLRQVNEFCFKYRIFRNDCTRIVGHVSGNIQSIFHGKFYNNVHASFHLMTRSLLVLYLPNFLQVSITTFYRSL